MFPLENLMGSVGSLRAYCCEGALLCIFGIQVAKHLYQPNIYIHLQSLDVPVHTPTMQSYLPRRKEDVFLQTFCRGPAWLAPKWPPLKKYVRLLYAQYIVTYGGFRKWWYPQIIHFNRVFHCKPSILGTPIFGNPHIYILIFGYSTVPLNPPESTWTGWGGLGQLCQSLFADAEQIRLQFHNLNWLVVFRAWFPYRNTVFFPGLFFGVFFCHETGL